MGFPKSWTSGVSLWVTVFAVLASIQIVQVVAEEEGNAQFPPISLLPDPTAPVIAPAVVQTSCMPPISTSFDRCLNAGTFSSGQIDDIASSLSTNLMSVTIDFPERCENTSFSYSSAPECPNASQLQQIIQDGQKAMLGSCCQMKKNMAIKGELTCMQQALTQVNSNLKNIQTAMKPLLDTAQKDIAQMDSDIKDRNSQIAEIGNRLNGDGSKKGLRQIKQELEGMVAALPALATKMKTQAKVFEDEKGRLNVLVKQHTMSLAWQCFANKPQPGKTCPGTGPTSYLKWISCQHGQYMLAKKGNRNKATNLSNSLEQYFTSTISVDMPKLTEFPKFQSSSGGAEGAQFDAAIGSSRITTPQDFYNAYIPSLKNLELKGGFPISGQANAGMSECYNQAAAQVAAQQGDPNSPIRMADQRLKDRDELVKSQWNSEIQNYWGRYQDMTAALLPTVPPGDSNKCLQGTFSDKANCMSMFANMANALLNGQPVKVTNDKIGEAGMALTGGSGPLFDIPTEPLNATNPKLAFPMQCMGVRRCVAKYEQLDKAFKQDIKNATDNREKYHAKVNKILKDKAAVLSQQLSQASKLLRDKMAKLSKAGANLGLNAREVSKPGKINENSELYDDEALKKMVLAGAEPPLYDMSDEAFNTAIAGRDSNDKEMNETFGNAIKVISEARANKVKCETEKLIAIKEKECSQWESKYDQKEDEIQSLKQQLAALQFGSGTATTDIEGNKQKALGLETLITNERTDPNSGLTYYQTQLDNCRGYVSELQMKSYGMETNTNFGTPNLSGDTLDPRF